LLAVKKFLVGVALIAFVTDYASRTRQSAICGRQAMQQLLQQGTALRLLQSNCFTRIIVGMAKVVRAATSVKPAFGLQT
jgi:hypothetical protein